VVWQWKPRRGIGRRGACLLNFGGTAVVYGVALITVDDREVVNTGMWLQMWLFPHVGFWGSLWIIVGVAAVAASFLPPGGPHWNRDGIGFVPLGMMCAAWAVAYFAAAVLDGLDSVNAPRAVLWGVIYTCFAVTVAIVAGWLEHGVGYAEQLRTVLRRMPPPGERR
jgi:hypothetical protein